MTERVRRALLFMPGDDLHKIRKGTTLDVDSVIMDLEDGVALNRKSEARATVREALLSTEIDFGRTERLVRLNSADSGLQSEDLATTLEGQPDGYVLPKVETAETITTLSTHLHKYEASHGLPAGTIRLLAIIETAKGIINLQDIAAADARLDALMFGAEDLAGSIGAMRTPEGGEVFYASSAVILHAAAYGLQAIDTPYVNLRDPEGLRDTARKASQMGFAGKMAIHPAQVPVITEAFTPDDVAIENARRLVEAHDAHQQSGTGVFAYEGKMVDRPMIRAAERVLARAKAAGKL